MSRPDFKEYTAALNDELMLPSSLEAWLALDTATTRAALRQVEEHEAFCKRVLAKLDETPTPLRAWVEGERPTLGGGK